MRSLSSWHLETTRGSQRIRSDPNTPSSDDEDNNPVEQIPISRLVALAGDPKVIQFLLLVLVLDAVGLLGKATTLASGVC